MRNIDFQLKERRNTMRFIGLKDLAIRLIVLVLAITTACTLYGCSGKQAAESKLEPVVSIKDAKTVALEDAGVDPEETLVTRRKLSEDAGVPVYLICFTTWTDNRTVRYEYDIDGNSGDILDSRKKTQSFSSARIENETKVSDYKTAADFIGVVRAKALVLEDTGLKKDETEFRTMRLEVREKRALYVTEFYSMGITYMFHIDAVTGKVLSREVQFND